MARLLVLIVTLAIAGFAIGCGDLADQVTTPEKGGLEDLSALNAVGQVFDPVGDAYDDPRTDPDPDLLAAEVVCDGTTMHFNVTCVPGTFLPEGAYLGFQLDADQDAATGFPGVDLANNDAGIIGLEFVLYVGDLGPTATLYKFLSLPNNFMTVGTYPVTPIPDGYSVAVPVGDLDGDDGAMNYKLTAQAVISPGSWTGVLDYMPDLGLPPGSSEPCTLIVPIDIKPGSDPNSVNCQNENALITVAILSTMEFDALSVDYSSVVFQGATEWHVDKKTGMPRLHVDDVNYDGLMDLVFHFRLADTDLDCDSIEGTLYGLLLDGTPIMGSDAVRMAHKFDQPAMP